MTSTSWRGASRATAVRRLLWCSVFLQVIALQQLAWASIGVIETMDKGGFVCASMDAAERLCRGTDCGALYPNMIKKALQVAPEEARGILAFGAYTPGSAARTALDGWVKAAGYSPSIITYVTNPAAVKSYNISTYKLLFVPSGERVVQGGISADMVNALVAIKGGIADFVNLNGGSLIALAQPVMFDELEASYPFFPAPLKTTLIYDQESWFSDVSVTNEMSLISPSTQKNTISDHQWLGFFYGPVDWSGLRVVAYQTGMCPTPQGKNQDCQATVLCNTKATLTAENCYDGVDNDGDTWVDKEDPDCERCGDGVALAPPKKSVTAQFLQTTLSFRRISPYFALCDATSMERMRGQLATALNLPTENVTVTCEWPKNGAGSRRLLQDTDGQDSTDTGDSNLADVCGANSPSYTVNIKPEGRHRLVYVARDPTVPYYEFKVNVWNSVNSKLAGLCPLGSFDGDWAQNGYTVGGQKGVVVPFQVVIRVSRSILWVPMGCWEKTWSMVGVTDIDPLRMFDTCLERPPVAPLLHGEAKYAESAEEKEVKKKANIVAPVVGVIVGVFGVGAVVGITVFLKKRKSQLYESDSAQSDETAASRGDAAGDKAIVITNEIFSTTSGATNIGDRRSEGAKVPRVLNPHIALGVALFTETCSSSSTRSAATTPADARSVFASNRPVKFELTTTSIILVLLVAKMMAC
ncbi:hypothetical protein VOLCADRAFT_91480 [Volvox carteri f. nagariensis]|uniref:Uncharacterized protein n=1 Tax=Volvox carteri f. nagariensis TaxID=3068 RepID=D8TX67_VOLCA|nr:uncharacterized protein VOLCADRAFT_91480 [Volvox carteri f. nagariensis]EFJ47958.1 hypothetical protein VOLCADRAFT_91480 [Volvox carteri f. nagariensis]|eukprot:XP_002951064.1 hypothetical protein VOLCADRAFT_91480 [Volvox carteri f. nagariensis]